MARKDAVKAATEDFQTAVQAENEIATSGPLTELSYEGQSLLDFEAQNRADTLAEFEVTADLYLDADLLFAALDTVAAGFKQIRALFNPADSRGDVFVNAINLLENQIEGLRASVSVEDLGDPINQDGLK